MTPGLAIAGVRVSAANTVAITYMNVTSAAIVPPVETYTIGNFQAPIPGTGNVVYQTMAPVAVQTSNLVNAERSALVSLGAIAGT